MPSSIWLSAPVQNCASMCAQEGRVRQQAPWQRPRTVDHLVFTATMEDLVVQVLGKRLGKSMKPVGEAIRALTREQIAEFERSGQLTVQGHQLEEGDLKVGSGFRVLRLGFGVQGVGLQESCCSASCSVCAPSFQPAWSCQGSSAQRPRYLATIRASGPCSSVSRMRHWAGL